MIKNRRHLVLYPILLAILLTAILCGLGFGSVMLSPLEIYGALFLREGYETQRIILLNLRLPRVLAAGLAGIGLSAAGLLLQSATDNDLCAPNVIGVNAGAGFAVMVFLCLMPWAYRLIPLAAFIGALLTTLLVLALSFAGTYTSSKATVVLAGVAVSAIFNAGIAFLQLKFPDVLSSYTAFSVGGFTGVEIGSLAIPAIIIFLCLTGSLFIAHKINLLALGDGIALSLGVDVKKLRLCTLVLASALCASVVSYAGLLGFVGLIVPHMARRIAGSSLCFTLPAACLIGASLVIFADLGGRILFAPSELPAGILLAVIGGPFFLYLLLKRRGTYA